MQGDLPIRPRGISIRPHRSHRTLRAHPAAQLVNFAILLAGLAGTYAFVQLVWPITSGIATAAVADGAQGVSTAGDVFLGIVSTIPSPHLPSLDIRFMLTVAGACASLVLINRLIPHSRHPLRLWIDGNLLVLMIVAIVAFFSGQLAYDGPSFMLLVERTSVLMLLVAPVFCAVVTALLPFSILEKIGMLLLLIVLDLLFATVRLAAFALVVAHFGAIS